MRKNLPYLGIEEITWYSSITSTLSSKPQVKMCKYSLKALLRQGRFPPFWITPPIGELGMENCNEQPKIPPLVDPSGPFLPQQNHKRSLNAEPTNASKKILPFYHTFLPCCIFWTSGVLQFPGLCKTPCFKMLAEWRRQGGSWSEKLYPEVPLSRQSSQKSMPFNWS